jgi:hypothetical protein
MLRLCMVTGDGETDARPPLTINLEHIQTVTRELVALLGISLPVNSQQHIEQREAVAGVPQHHTVHV